MNILQVIQVDYINYASRTLETIMLSDKNNNIQKIVYVYNYEGVHFRIFDNILEVSKFLNGEKYTILKDYLKERYVDFFLEKFC